MSTETEFDRLNARRLQLLAQKYLGDGLTQREADTLDRLHKKIERLAPDISLHILQQSASRPPLLLRLPG